VPVISIRALRHGWATLAREAGVPMKVVQDCLYHSSEEVTADIYTQVRKAVESDAAERVAAQIFGSGDPWQTPIGRSGAWKCRGPTSDC
jgi:integrase